MGRTVVRPAAPQRGRKNRDLVALVVLGIVGAFAVLGVVSAGLFVVDRMSGASSSTSAPRTGSRTATDTNRQAAKEVARAQAQATALVKAAKDASGAIIKNASARARRESRAIVTAARRVAAAVPTSAPNAPGVSPPSPAYSGGFTSGTAPQTYVTPVPTLPAIGALTQVPSLAGAPASWLVVGYNATFGAGPGSAGGISVLNRSSHTFGGVATVRYANGQVATAPFSGLAPGQSAVLPLNGPRYPGGKYSITFTNLK